MIVPEGYAELVSGIEAGAQVCKTLFMLFTADNKPQADYDRTVIKARLASCLLGGPGAAGSYHTVGLSRPPDRVSFVR
jgi:hypothetical protein